MWKNDHESPGSGASRGTGAVSTPHAADTCTSYSTDMGGTGSDMSMDGPDGSTPTSDGGGSGTDMDTPVTDMGGAEDMLPDGAVVLDGGSVCFPATCQGRINACGDCIDNDGDGLVDSMDPNCLGACDNNETGLYHEIPGGDTPNCKLDCYYDSDQGSGNDRCSFDARCDMESPDELCPYVEPPPGNARCGETQPDACLDFCQPLTPNGCDCFGCCEIAGNTVFVGTYDRATDTHTCTLEAAIAGDFEACHPCTQQTDCFNDCGPCELCLGRDPEDLPEECFPPPPEDMGTPMDLGTPPDGSAPPADMFTPSPRCPDGRQPCGLDGDALCPANYFCLTGCCTLFG